MGKKSTPKPPPAPNPFEVAAADAQYNRINQYTPLGNLIFTQPGQEPAQGMQTGFVSGGLSPTAQNLLSGKQTAQPAPQQPGMVNSMKGSRMQPPPQIGAGSNAQFMGGSPKGSPTAPSNASASATIQLPPALQFAENLRLTSDVNMMADALGRQAALNPNPIDLSQFGPIQSNIDTTGINFQGPQIGNLPNLSAPNFQQVGGGPQLQQNVGSNLPIFNSFQTQQAPNVPSLQTGIDTSGLPQIPQNYEQFRGDVESAMFNRGRSLLDPVFADQERALTQNLASRGLPTTGEATDIAMTRFLDARNRAYSDLANQSTITAGQEASRSLGDILGSQGQQFGQRLAGGQFGNNALLGQFGAGLQGAQFNAGQSLANAQFGNQAQAQQFGQNVAAGQFGNEAQQAMFQNMLAGTGFNNQALAQGLAANADIRNQLFNEGIGLSGANNAAMAQNLALRQQLLQNQNAGRAQGLNEQAAVRQNQFNELASLLGLQQVQAPTFQNFIQPGQVDMMGAFGLQQSALNNAYNAQMQNRSAMLGGLFGLGSAALMGPFADIFN